jgi:uncharacterized protein (DUF2062 family)
MPRRFFRKFALKRHDLSEKWFMAPFRHLLNDHRLWGVRRKSVVPALALGLFIAFLPFPGHFLTAALAALALKVNIPVAALATVVVNPVTVYPAFRYAYLVGTSLLSIEPGPFSFELSFDWLTNTAMSVWQPLLLGSVLIGALFALVGAALLDGLWRLSIHDYKTRKRDRRHRG